MADLALVEWMVILVKVVRAFVIVDDLGKGECACVVDVQQRGVTLGL
jgi:hypothetical protein